MDPCAVPDAAHTLFFSARKLLLVLHTAAAVVLIGSATHHLLQMPARLRGAPRLRLERIYALVVAVTYALTYALGALLYPTYRYHVRALFLDRYHPAVSNLFDIKENLATIALLVALGMGAVGGRLTTEMADRALVRVYVGMAAFVAAVVWFNVVSGVVIVSYRSV